MNTAKYMSEKWSPPELFRMIVSSVFMAATAVDTESSPAYSWKQHSTPAAQMRIGEAGTAECGVDSLHAQVHSMCVHSLAGVGRREWNERGAPGLQDQ